MLVVVRHLDHTQFAKLSFDEIVDLRNDVSTVCMYPASSVVVFTFVMKFPKNCQKTFFP